ncbi:MAG: radical SAM protein [Anaerolineaceae bacterium]|nr:radical SAM protein [Anaerolineaceae bacterium]
MIIKPSYLKLYESGVLKKRAKLAVEMLSQCTGCAWMCRKNRLEGQKGQCNTGALARVSSFGPHLGEEDPIRGTKGSGTIFFSSCNLHCQFCQNYEISQQETGSEVGSTELAGVMLTLQSMGCHNINLVSPSHVIPHIIEALHVAIKEGLRIPLVYNSGGYDSLDALRLLDGIVDIYMPDMKYADSAMALKYSKIPDYPQINQRAVKEMYRQTGNLDLDESGLAVKGLLVRHLVLPNNLAGSKEIFNFLAREISKDTYINIMDQYQPSFHANKFPDINRPITRKEFDYAIQSALNAGLHRLDGRKSSFLINWIKP